MFPLSPVFQSGWSFSSVCIFNFLIYLLLHVLSSFKNKFNSIDDLVKKDNSLTFHQRNIHQVAIEMYKVKHDLSPPFMKEMFTNVGNVKGTRSGDNLLDQMFVQLIRVISH